MRASSALLLSFISNALCAFVVFPYPRVLVFILPWCELRSGPGEQSFTLRFHPSGQLFLVINPSGLEQGAGGSQEHEAAVRSIRTVSGIIGC